MTPLRFLRGLIAAAVSACALTVASAETRLRYTDHEPLGGMRPNFLKNEFLAAMEKESGGRLKVEDKWDSSVATGYDALRAIGRDGKADLGVVVPEYSDKELPLHQLFKSFPRGPAGARQVDFFRKVYAEVPELTAELRASNLVPIFYATGYPVAFFSPRPMASLADLKGHKWRTASFWHRDFLRNAGSTPVTIPWGIGVFNALKAGELDGLVVNIDSGYMLRVHEVAPHVLASRDLWLGHLYIVAMNATVWEGLAPEDKAAIRRAADAAYGKLGAVMDESMAAMAASLAKEGASVRLLEPAEVRTFETATRFQVAQAAWTSSAAAQGAPASAVLARIRAVLNESLR